MFNRNYFVFDLVLYVMLFIIVAMAEDVKVDSTENESPEQKAMDFTEESKDLNVSAGSLRVYFEFFGW